MYIPPFASNEVLHKMQLQGMIILCGEPAAEQRELKTIINSYNIVYFNLECACMELSMMNMISASR